MATLRSEDPARNLHSPWLGPTNAWRWWFDATYTEWGVGAGAWMVLGTLLYWAVPAGLVLAVIAVWAARVLASRFRADYLAHVLRTSPQNGPQRARRVLAATFLLFAVAILPRPRAWLLPLPLLLAAAAAAVLAVLTVRAARPFLDGNRPLTYWWRLLRSLSRGPRAQRAVASLAWTRPPAINDDNLDDDVAQIWAVVNATDPEDITVIRYRARQEHEAMLFDSRTGQPQECEHVLAWLRERGLEVAIVSVRQWMVGNRIVSRTVTVKAAGQVLRDGQVIVLAQGDPRPVLRALSPADFARSYVEVSTDAVSA